MNDPNAGSGNYTLDLGSSCLPEDFDWVSAYEGHVNAYRLAIAFLTLVVWDFALTSLDRVQLFWGARWSISKTLYVINRYTTLFTMSAVLLLLAVPSPSTTFCNVVPWIELAGNIILLILIGVAMISRVCAMWNFNKWVLTSVCFLCVSHIIIYSVIVSYTYARGAWVPAGLPFTGCLIVLGFEKLWIVFIPNLVFETVIISLIVYKSWSIAAQTGIRTPLYTNLLEDGIVYYLAVMASQVLSLVCLLVPSVLTIPIIRSYPAFAVTGIACNRLFTRLQRLLISKGKGQSGFSAHNIWSSIIPESKHDNDQTDSKPMNVQMPQPPPSKCLVRMYMTRHNGRYQRNENLEKGLRMEPIRRRTQDDDDDDLEGYSDREVDASGCQTTIGSQKRRGLGHRDLETQRSYGTITGVEVLVKVDSDGPVGPFTYGEGKSVLDPSSRREPSNKPGSEDVGSIIVSRMGRYD